VTRFSSVNNLIVEICNCYILIVTKNIEQKYRTEVSHDLFHRGEPILWISFRCPNLHASSNHNAWDLGTFFGRFWIL